MHHLDLILTLTGGLAAALVLGYLTHRLGLSPIVGYLMGGIAVGPHTPGFIANQALAEQLAEIGVILLMFGVGLQFHLKELLAVRRVALPGAIVQSLVATGLGAMVARAFGWDWAAGIVLGLALSVASTVVLMRVLADHRDLHTPTGHIAVGWLVVEDLFTVLVLVLLPALFSGRPAGSGHMPLALGLATLKIIALVAFTLLVGGRLIPWLLERVAATRSRELFTLTILVLALGIAVGSALLFGVSMALGAFLAGMVVGRSDFSLRAASEALPMRDAFAVLFFISVGMLLNPRSLLAAPGLVLATLGVIMVGKPLAALGIVLAARVPVQGGAHCGRGVGPDWRVLLHPGGAWERTGSPHRGRHEYRRSCSHCLHYAQSAPVSMGRCPRHPSCTPATPLGLAQRPDADACRLCFGSNSRPDVPLAPSPPGCRGGLWPGWTDRHTPAPGQRYRAHRH